MPIHDLDKHLVHPESRVNLPFREARQPPLSLGLWVDSLRVEAGQTSRILFQDIQKNAELDKCEVQ